ncbi:hypothetical protein QYE76_022919 [Lolium multiflorum]|uniref:Uncharacterized protein n=1 Tax=Lolium multiflorum TaxID=4521 RepID=A0AAD8VRS6_LOLMU|nr:hypothetical protein QYE76_022919 [Lolium multiflorum]
MTRARAKAIHDKVNSLLTTLDLDTPLDGMLPHAETLCVIRYMEHQDPGEDETSWSREGEEQQNLEMNMKPKPPSPEDRQGRKGRWPVQDPVGPDPRPDAPATGPVNRAQTGPAPSYRTTTGPKTGFFADSRNGDETRDGEVLRNTERLATQHNLWTQRQEFKEQLSLFETRIDEQYEEVAHNFSTVNQDLALLREATDNLNGQMAANDANMERRMDNLERAITNLGPPPQGMKTILVLIDHMLVKKTLALTQGEVNSIAMLVLMNDLHKNKFLTKIVIKRLAMPTMGVTTNPTTTSSTTWRHMVMLPPKVVKSNQGVISAIILAMTNVEEETHNMIKTRGPSLDIANNLAKTLNNILHVNQVKQVFNSTANPMLWLDVKDLLYHLKPQEMKATVLAAATWKMKRICTSVKTQAMETKPMERELEMMKMELLRPGRNFRPPGPELPARFLQDAPKMPSSAQEKASDRNFRPEGPELPPGRNFRPSSAQAPKLPQSFRNIINDDGTPRIQAAHLTPSTIASSTSSATVIKCGEGNQLPMTRHQHWIATQAVHAKLNQFEAMLKDTNVRYEERAQVQRIDLNNQVQELNEKIETQGNELKATLAMQGHELLHRRIMIPIKTHATIMWMLKCFNNKLKKRSKHDFALSKNVYALKKNAFNKNISMLNSKRNNNVFAMIKISFMHVSKKGSAKSKRHVNIKGNLAHLKWPMLKGTTIMPNKK